MSMLLSVLVKTVMIAKHAQTVPVVYKVLTVFTVLLQLMLVNVYQEHILTINIVN